MEDQGKRKSQMKDSETFAIIALIAALIAVLLILVSCKPTAQETITSKKRVYIHMSDRDSLELVTDEYGNQYLKECIGWPRFIYIPYSGETDTLKFINIKNK
jgi:hypothetical protein